MNAQLRTVLLVLLISVIFSACGPTPPGVDVILVPESGGAVVAVSQVYKDPTLLQSVLSEIYSFTENCPLTDGKTSEAILDMVNLPHDAIVRICGTYEATQKATIYVASVLAIPAAIEPSFLGEMADGSVVINGKVAAVIFLYSGVGIAWASAVIAGEAPVALALEPLDAVFVDGWESSRPQDIPIEALKDLARADHHARARHRTARCISAVSNSSLKPQRVYVATKDPTVPEIMFLWNGAAILRELANLVECSDLQDRLAEEYSEVSVPKPGDVYLAMVVGYNFQEGRYFTYSAFPIKAEILPAHLCEHGYTAQVYPKLRPVPCPGW